MKKYASILIASALALLLAVVVIFRINARKTEFDRSVREALSTSEGYDEQFIEMVNNLEDELARRASFGYEGGKDPMTGRTRRVVKPKRVVRRRTKKKAVDPVKLTAIIFDDRNRQFTAIVMDGERSYSVEVGDRVRDRRITDITSENVIMKSSSKAYVYDIYGKSKTYNR